MEIVGEVGLYVDADTTPYRQSLIELKQAGRALGREIGRTTAAEITREMLKGARQLLAKLVPPLNKIRALWAKTADVTVANLKKISRSIRATILTAVEPFKMAVAGALLRVRDEFIGSAFIIDAALAKMKSGISPIMRQLEFLAAVANTVLTKLKNRFIRAGFEVAAAVQVIKLEVKSLVRAVATQPVVAAATRFGSALANSIKVGFSTAFAATKSKISSALNKIIPVSVRTKVVASATSMGSAVARGLKRITTATIGPTLAIKAFGKASSSFRKMGVAAVAALPGIKRFSRGFKIAISPLASMAKRVAASVKQSFAGMDRTVRLVLVSIIFAAGPISALGSSMSAAMIGVAAAAVFAAAALAPLIGIIAPLGLAVLGAAVGFKDLKKYAPEAASALDSMKKSFKEVAVPALMKEWGGSLTGFFGSLKGFLSGDIFGALGKALSGITNSLTGALNSGAAGALKEALAGPLTQAFETLGSALGPILETLMGFFAATAPFALRLSEMFAAWATDLAATFATANESGALTDFFNGALRALVSIIELVGPVKDALMTLFAAGLDGGIAFIDTIAALVRQFDDWMKSAEGQTALQEFFDGIATLMPPLGELVAGLATAISDLITPDVIADTVELLKALAGLAPTLSDVLAIIGNANVVNLLADAIGALGKLIDPLVEPLSGLLGILSELLSDVLTEMGPMLTDVGSAFGDVFKAIGPLLEIIMPLVKVLAEGFSQVLIAIAPLITSLVSALSPLLTSLVAVLMPVLDPIIGLITTLAEVLGPILTPIIQILTPIIDLLLVPLGLLGPIFELLSPILELVGVLLDVILQVISAILTPILTWIAGLSEATGASDKLSTGITTLSGWITSLVDIIKKWLAETDIGAWIETAWNNITEWGGKILTWFEELPGKVAGFFLTMADTISAPFKNAFNGIADMWNNSVGKLSFTVPDIIGVPNRGETFNFPKIAKFATGGIANEASIFGEGLGREAAVPLDLPTPFVDPSVRALSAFAKGELKFGSTSNVYNMNLVTRATNGKIVARQVLDEIAQGAL